MKSPKIIDMTRPIAVYLGMTAVLFVAVFVKGRSGWQLPMPFVIPYQQAVATGLFVLSVSAGLSGSYRHSLRTVSPWKVPQVQVFLWFLLYFLLGAAAVAVSN